MYQQTQEQNPEARGDASRPGERQRSVLSSLLENLDEAACANLSPQAHRDAAHQNRLALSRLGVASALFFALRAKHAATAAHSLRVALTCSAWSFLLELSVDDRDVLEVAALLHDVGKIGIPDRVLLKPGELSAEETGILHRHRDHAREILSTCCTSQAVVDAIFYSGAWFDGRGQAFDRYGEELPRAARILAIVEAFDAMTTDHVFRRAMSRERAMTEMFEAAGTQFDPLLIRKFISFLGSDHYQLRASVVSHWLQELTDDSANGCWQRRASPSRPQTPDVSGVFHEQLLDSLHASVVFVDSGLTILKWSRECEALTGLVASSVEGLRWDPGLIQLRDANFSLLAADSCPVINAMQRGSEQRVRLVVTNAQGEKVSVDAHVAPVRGADGRIVGATLLMFDASSQMDLERQVECLHEKASQDGLTKIANRAEFDRRHEALVRTHHERETSYSLIICDLDHFKRVNDTYGHPTGDEALVTFAALLKRFCRTGDLVARYGGEEFVVLCADCDHKTATARADAIREAWAAKPHPLLSGKCLTCSFGVTELQTGDTAETMLRRADRALLQAKDNGRNSVVSLGGGRERGGRATVAS